MVVQRSWKIQGDATSSGNSVASTSVTKPLSVSGGGGNSSSEDSNGSNQTTHSIATSITSSSNKAQDTVAAPSAQAAIAATIASNSETIKYVTTPQMAENMLLRLRQRLCPPIVGSNATSEAVMRSLELLRINVQNIFDMEINAVVKKFMDTYFKPAFNNIKENMGNNSISDDMLQKMTCVLLENSKSQYTTFRVKPNVIHTTAQLMQQVRTADTPTGIPLRLGLKRPAALPKNLNANETFKKVASLPIQQQQLSGINTATNTTTQSADSTPVRKLTVAQPRRQIFWNTANISTNTNFVLDVQANQAFGFGTDGKERLASKHPELIRYLPDGDDRDWLISQNIISQQNRNSRFLFLIYDEVFKLYQNNDLYKKKPNISLSIMHTFKVPEFMIQKMKLFFVDLNIKSRGLITNSFCAASVQSNSHLRNALLQGQTQSLTTSSSMATTSTSVEPTNSCISGSNTSSNVGGTASTGNAVVQGVSTSSEGTASSTLISLKSKPSTLSSSHATLTALLNNSANSVGDSIIRTNNANSRNAGSTSTYSSEKLAKKPASKTN